jgi:hypothetical protein
MFITFYEGLLDLSYPAAPEGNGGLILVALSTLELNYKMWVSLFTMLNFIIRISFRLFSEYCVSC